ncbi:enoyl-CoA hydratase/isomerase family protein [Sulfitobacter mediterraneus]|uniref:enoyl-CoA hydratase-related protein n=1 Tax=Sulfitobacter TaxID=60136 RepID=UPI0019320D86|nr:MULTISPECIES: enoyl-CoA hydratase-related protein [Sulfitobacter]MBM1635130.1 enoyl-CoA hydratase/isomerase family protein [Sulfitobacter mediterraneus]MBM1642954.1 enoyl-CoA hydratase/isomerase family protein [Sulfitobacter mediterraneus]MBM1647002.1 enoyl-CoA hydratase/isomerase family protein [Sulfitobacter mediterraneus]MBM1651044.1 enoyl-CoA hydratase/isomerase family protein [Sulfitobacter mediterraneus]MBM1655055.1 enoyl-CoA hydratase/isomerase family protein [Sulfitobacter mediterra
MSYEFIKTEKQGHILIVTMNRPDVYNAVHVDMHNEMADCWDAFAADQDLWVAVLTGAGDKAFSAGNDLKATAAGGSKKEMTPSGFAGLSARFDLEKPIIAAVNGFAMGGGFETALSCDIILASENAKFALPEVKVGFFAAASGVQRLSRYIGRLAAQELMYTGRTISAAEALELGCVNAVHPHDELMEKAMEKAEQLCSVSPSAVKATKRVLNDMYARDGMQQSIGYSREVIADLSKTEDFKEGVNAFVEKRAPQWVNK